MSIELDNLESSENKWKIFLDDIQRTTGSIVKSGLLIDTYSNHHDKNYIKFTNKSIENCSWKDLIRTENVIFNESLIILCQLCTEFDDFTKLIKNKYIPSMIIYEKACITLKSYDDYLIIKNFSNFIFTLTEIRNFWHTTFNLLNNTLTTLFHLFTSDKKSKLIQLNNEFNSLIVYLGNFFFTLCELSFYHRNHNLLSEHFKKYEKIFINDQSIPQRCDLENKKYLQYINAFYKLHNSFKEDPLKNLFSKLFETKKDFASLDKHLLNFMNINLGHLLNQIRSNSINHITSSHFKAHLGLFVLISQVFKPNIHTATLLLNFAEKADIVYRIGNHVIYAPKFLFDHIPNFEYFVSPRLINRLLSNIANHKAIELNPQKEREIYDLRVKIIDWCLIFEDCPFLSFSTFKDNTTKYAQPPSGYKDNPLLPEIYTGVKLLLTTVNLINKLLTSTCESKTKNFSCLYSRFNSLIDCLFYIRKCFHQNNMNICSLLAHARIKDLKYLNQIIIDLNSKFKSKYSEMIDSMSAYSLAFTTVKFPLSWQRCTILMLCFEILFKKKSRTQEIITIFETLELSKLYTNFYEFLDDLIDTSFMYLNLKLLRIYLHEVTLKSSLIYRLENISYIVDDSVKYIHKAVNMSEEDKLNAISLFKKTIKDILIQKIVIPVSIEIENYLRINNYNDKNLNDNSGFNNFNKLISLEKIRIYDEYFSFSSNVTEYLERKIFTHTIICPFEYRNYENMRQFYQNQLGIPMLRTFLPVQQVDHGIDAGEILQNIDSFIEDYSYNLQNQIFVQRYSNSNYLKTFQIKHIKNAFRINGLGLFNPSIDTIYQSLKQKIVAFSQNLLNFQINTRLIKEISAFETKSKTVQQYPIECIPILIRDIRAISVSTPNIFDFEQLKELICQIGNSMGLVRIFRNGILSFLNNNHEYISKDMIPFSISEKLSSLHSHITYTAAKNFEGILNDLSIDTDIEIEYFNVFTNVFQDYFYEKHSSQLKNFYILVPSLIYSSIETKRKGIENINTKNIEENRFIEDGIILGISFILRITKSWTDFESLNFFNSLENKIQEEKKKLSLELANEDSKLMNSLKLTINKINNFEKNFLKIRYNYESIKKFFDKRHIEKNKPKKNDSDGKSMCSINSIVSKEELSTSTPSIFDGIN